VKKAEIGRKQRLKNTIYRTSVKTYHRAGRLEWSAQGKRKLSHDCSNCDRRKQGQKNITGLILTATRTTGVNDKPSSADQLPGRTNSDKGQTETVAEKQKRNRLSKKPISNNQVC
jgi:hypothetical protein